MLHDNAISFRHLNSTDHIVLYLQNGDCIVTSLDPMYTALISWGVLCAEDKLVFLVLCKHATALLLTVRSYELFTNYPLNL